MTSPFEISRSFCGVPLISSDASPLSREAVGWIETTTGPLPKDYLDFLISCNGGRPVDAFLEFHGSKPGSDKITVTRFSTINVDSIPHLWNINFQDNSFTFMTTAESHGQPIAVRLDPVGYGQIYFIRDTTPYDYFQPSIEYSPNLLNKNPEHYSIELVSNSFTQFFSQLNRVSNNSIPSKSEILSSVDLCCRHGDHFFQEAVTFLDRFSTDELNEKWPTNGQQMANTLTCLFILQLTGLKSSLPNI